MLRQFLLLLLLAASLSAQSFESFVDLLQRTPVNQRQAMVDSFLRDHPASPLYEDDTVVVFLFSGKAESVSVAGDATSWRPGVDTMTVVQGTTLWFCMRSFPPDSRLDYKYVIDGRDWIIDPRNDRIVRGGFGNNSELRMPGVAEHRELTRRPGVARGTILDSVVTSEQLMNERQIRIYVPPHYDPEGDSLSLLLVHDGPEFIDLVGMDIVLDNLIADRAIPPVLGVFVPPVERSREYSSDLMSQFSRFLVEDVLTDIRKKYRITTDPSRTVVMGASNGGNISLYMATVYPHTFGRVAAFSSNVVPRVMTAFDSENKLPLSIYLDIGTYDIPQLVPLVQSLVSVLEAHHYPLMYKVHHDGHSWANWGSHVGDALQFLLPGARNE